MRRYGLALPAAMLLAASLSPAASQADPIQAYAFGESTVAGAASTQFTGAERVFPAPALRVDVVAPVFSRNSSVLVAFDDREFAGSGRITNCEDPLRSLACDDSGTRHHGQFDARDWIVQEHAGVRVPKTPVYVDVANRYRASTDEKIDVEGVGYGVETLPPAQSNGGLFGSAFFFPNVLNEHGVFPDVALEGPFFRREYGPGSIPVRYSVAQYELGATHPISKHIFFDGGVRADSSWRLINAPQEGTKVGIFVGTGTRL